MKDKTKYQKGYRNPRTTQERRINGKRSKWGRAKRNQSNLVEAYDDRPVCLQKTWKVKRQHQYRCGGRGAEHRIIFFDHSWSLSQWFNANDIPYRITPIYKTERVVRASRRVRRVARYEEKTIVHWNGVVERYQHPIYEYRCIEPKECVWRHRIGYELTWWYDKDIDIMRVLRQCGVEI